MSQFKILQGNYTELTCMLIPELEEENLEEKNNDIQAVWNQIKIDLHRTVYFSQHYPVDRLKKRLQTDFFRHSDRNTYDQGGFDGGLPSWNFSYLAQVLRLVQYISNHQLDPAELLSKIRVCYADDSDELCGFSILVAADPSSLEDGPIRYQYVIAIYRHITATPENREVTYITDVELLRNKRLGETIASSDILSTVKALLNSAVLFEAIEPIIAGQDYAAKTPFDNLRACLVPNCNGYTEVQKLNALQHAEVVAYRTQLNNIFHSETDGVLKRSFFRRNGPALLFLLVNACIGMSAFVLTIPMTVIFAALILGIFSSANILKDESALRRYQENRTLETTLATAAFNESISHISHLLINTPSIADDPTLKPVVNHKSPYLSYPSALPPETSNNSPSPATFK